MNGKGISLVDSDEDVTEVGIGKNGPWSYKNECIYVDLMDEDVKNYNSRVTGSFTKEAWQRIRKKLIKLIGYPYTDSQLKNKFNQLRITHTKFVSLCAQSGVGWCPIKARLKSFRKCGYPHYAAMTRVLGDNTAKGMNAFASTQSPSRTDSSDPEFKLKDEADIEDLEKVELLEIREKARAASITVSSPEKNDPLGLFTQCLSILNGMDDLDGLSYSKAMTKLKEDPTWRPIFLGIPDKRKMDWCTSLP
ncbi:hypothetical protein Acr_13g0000950 [Actinidia rufa]|uniref:Myb/SANT-like domain-containing protein n=1 Tax=Actinidia rufa TaxID=165716 RepID=A0A7J0FJ14_9ERIC|nr:hypothetical protein Acr_13g0000950 [Actinidia rufa]